MSRPLAGRLIAEGLRLTEIGVDARNPENKVDPGLRDSEARACTSFLGARLSGSVCQLTLLFLALIGKRLADQATPSETRRSSETRLRLANAV
jgi:hypothetical protein